MFVKEKSANKAGRSLTLLKEEVSQKDVGWCYVVRGEESDNDALTGLRSVLILLGRQPQVSTN